MLMLDTKDSKHVRRGDLAAVPLPARTRTYVPVPHLDLVDLARTTFDRVLGAEPVQEAFGLARGGSHMFAVLTYDVGGTTAGLAVGLRNSYNRTLSAGIVAGQGVFVCSNLCFSGDLKVLRAHTKNVWADLPRLVQEAADQAVPEYNRLEAHRLRMAGTGLEDEEAWALLASSIVGPFFSRKIYSIYERYFL